MLVLDNFFDEGVCKTLEERLLINTFPWGYLSQSIPTPMQHSGYRRHGWPPAGIDWPAEIPKDDFMFIHNFFQEVDDLHKQMIKESNEEERDYMVSPCFDIIEPTILPIMEYFDFDKHSLLRIKANLDTVQNESITHCSHTDYPIYTHEDSPYTTAVFHVNDNNGATVVNGERIEQKSNRLIVFNGSSEHYGITQTDVNARLVVNYNFKAEL
jgi:hypothetical protein